MKIRPFWVDLLRANETTDRQTDMTKLIVAFRNFAEVPKTHVADTATCLLPTVGD